MDYLIFSNNRTFEPAADLVLLNKRTRIIEPPEFCHGLVAPSLEVSGGATKVISELESYGIEIVGVISAPAFSKDLPDAPPPGPAVEKVCGGLSVISFAASLTDPLKYRVELRPSVDLSPLIPILPSLLRGGAYNPATLVCSFEEEHRLIAFRPHEIVFSRIDDISDFWIIVRTTVDFLIAASKLIGTTAPETNPRYGIGAMEIFKRLPATNCGRCGSPNCMEFAMRLFRRHVKPEECAPLMTPEFAACEGSLRWLLHVIGIQDLPVDPAPGNQ